MLNIGMFNVCSTIDSGRILGFWGKVYTSNLPLFSDAEMTHFHDVEY